MSTQNRTSGKTTFRAHELFFNTIAKGLPNELPFGSVFSLKPLIERWETLADDVSDHIRTMANLVSDGLEKYPELAEPLTEYDLLTRHEELVSVILSPIFPHRRWTGELRALVDPFGRHVIYRTEALQELLRMEKDEYLSFWFDESILGTRILYAYRFILQKYYDTVMQVDQPIIHVLRSPDRLLRRYYKITATIDHVRVKNIEPVPDLGKADIHYLLSNVDNVGLWMECIPPHIFEFTGFQVVNMTDVTSEVSTASLEHILLKSDADVTEENFDVIQEEVQTFFRKPFLRVGLASLQKNGAFNFSSERHVWNSLVIRDDVHSGNLSVDGTIYEEVLQEDRALVLEDVSALAGSHQLRDCLIENEVHSLLLSPLRYENEVVGILELSSRTSGDLNALATLKLDLIESIFALAIHQNLVRFEERVTSTVRETFTAIHPSVAWRFREAAIAIMDAEKADSTAEVERIVFRDVYPLYGSADIRGSSDRRNEAVQSDLIQHLELVKKTLSEAEVHVPVTLIGEIRHRVNQRIDRLKNDFHSGDEAATNNFIVGEVNPFLALLKGGHPVLEPIIERYFEHVTTGGGLIVSEQRYYGQSVQRINDVISKILEDEQTELQKTCPHYFEKYKTDGVEHSMYIGASLLQDQPFDMAYVRNLRLHQLTTCCKIGIAIENLKKDLVVPLDVAQMVLVQDTSHSISFRMDEKKFDVDGAYGIRYEVVKKRIDKACSKGTNERLSQPGKILIIYAFDREEEEYRRYLEFMRSSQLIVGDVEEFDVEALQGVSGLRALRVDINLSALKSSIDGGQTADTILGE